VGEDLMPGLTRRELERLSYRNQPSNELRSEALGVLLTLISVAEHGKPLPGKDVLTRLFSSREDTPVRLKNAIAFVDRFEGQTLATYTDMVDAAQLAGILRRVNPGHVNSVSELTSLDAQHVLRIAGADFGPEVRWLTSVLAELQLAAPAAQS
jgi:hypothetical protein